MNADTMNEMAKAMDGLGKAHLALLRPLVEEMWESRRRLTLTASEVETMDEQVKDLNDRMDKIENTDDRLDEAISRLHAEMSENANDVDDELMKRVVELENQLARIIEWIESIVVPTFE